MYEINRRKTPRERKRQKNHFKSIPNLTHEDYDNEFFSYTPGVYEVSDDHDQSRMYRSLGYIPAYDNEDVQESQYTWNRESSKKRREKVGRSDRDAKLWSKSSDHLDAHHHEKSCSDVWRRYQPGAGAEPVARAGESYQQNFQQNYLVKDQYEAPTQPYSLPYNSNVSRHATLSRHVAHVPPVMVGTLRYRRDLIFSRWQERTFVLTEKYLKCFVKTNTNPNHTQTSLQQREKPQLLWKIKLNKIENMDLTTKKGYLTIKLLVHGDNCKIFLRSGHDTRLWFNMIMTCCNQSVSNGAAAPKHAHVGGHGGDNQDWDQYSQPQHYPSRSDTIQRWLLGRPSVHPSNQAQSLPYYQHQHYQDYQDYQYGDGPWVQDQHYAMISSSNKSNCKNIGQQSRPKTAMSSKTKTGKEKSGKATAKNESQDSGNSSLSSPTQTMSSSRTKQYLSLTHAKY